jgi:hypothetical protein
MRIHIICHANGELGGWLPSYIETWRWGYFSGINFFQYQEREDRGV